MNSRLNGTCGGCGPRSINAETAMIRQEEGIIAVLLSPTVPPCLLIRLVEPRGGMTPVWRVPQVSFLTFLSIAGRKAGLLTVTIRLPASFSTCQTALTVFRDGRERLTTFALSVRQTLITLANHLTLRQPDLSCIRHMERHRSEQLVHSSWLRLEHSRLVQLRCMMNRSCCSHHHSQA